LGGTGGSFGPPIGHLWELQRLIGPADEFRGEVMVSVSDDVILEQVEFTYDRGGNLIQTVTRQRYHNAPDTQTGPLDDPSLAPKARVTVRTMYPDSLGRTVASVDYGTNGGGTFSRPDTIPARSDSVLVSSTSFDAAGNVAETVDPSGMVTQYEYDDAGRKTAVIENVQDVSSSSSSSSSSSGGCDPSDDANRTTRFTYTPDGQQATLTAVNPRTGDQTATWNYGTTLDDSEIASSQLLRSVTYPDSTGGSDVVSYSYNRQGERTTLTDQRGCVHTYDRDKLGRVLHDRVTTLGSGVDGAIRRLSTTYDVRGLTSKLTSWNNASVNSGDVVNECLFVFNSFSQLIADYQNHSGAVNTGTTPKVQYGYADGSANTIRPLTLTYPNGRVITYDYGTADGINDAISRIASLIDDDSTHLVDYSFLGLGIIVVVDYTEPDVKYTLVNLSGTNDPDTGDIYGGLDRFGRVKDCRWYDYGHSTDTVRLQYAYDRASNRLWRADPVAQSLGKDFDELCSYDGLHRLKDMQRGLLNDSNTAITNETFAQCWSLDPTSNWHGFKEATTGGAWTLDQSRSANTVNEITGITNTTGPTWVTPAYDAAGNTTTLPQPADPTKSYTATYDAWNRLVRLEQQLLTPLPILVKVSENQYDARNFRTVCKDYTLGVLATTRHVYYTSGWQGIEDRLGTIPDSAAPERQVIWGQRYIDDLVLRDRDTNADGTLDERLYGLQDANWNMVALIDTSATAQERYLYSPFGVPIFLDGSTSTVLATSAFDSEILFTGQRFDLLTFLHLFRMRWIDSLTGRFESRDPIGYAAGPNFYAGWFVPHFVDPIGLTPYVDTGEGLDTLDYYRTQYLLSRKKQTFSFGVGFELIRQNAGCPLIFDWNGTIWQKHQQGCVGFVSGLLGRNLSPSVLAESHRQDCYDTLPQALNARARWNKIGACCANRNMAGNKSTAQVIAFYYNAVDNVPSGGKPSTIDSDGHIVWNDERPAHNGRVTDTAYGSVFDYGLYDDATGAFWGADFNAGTPGSMATLWDLPGYFSNRKGRTIFCVLCEGNDPNKTLRRPGPNSTEFAF
jgi:RHS repeat-associated protein